MDWFIAQISGKMVKDFFVNKITEYTKNLRVYNEDTVKINKDQLNQLLGNV